MLQFLVNIELLNSNCSAYVKLIWAVSVLKYVTLHMVQHDLC